MLLFTFTEVLKLGSVKLECHFISLRKKQNANTD